MRTTVNLHSRTRLAEFLQRDSLLHLYALGDLDGFFWDRTTWFGSRDSKRGELQEVVLVYRAPGMPSVLAFQSGRDGAMVDLLRELRHSLPRAFHLHASIGVSAALEGHWSLTPRGRFHRMGLTDRGKIAKVDTGRTRPLLAADLDELLALYQVAYPGNFFDERMLHTGKYQGLWRGRHLVSVAGVHTWSPKHGIAALGNICTHPDHRGQGLARVTTAAVVKALGQTDTIGLNVHADNEVAIDLYERLGFARAVEYEEWIAGPK